jgi:uncharacterized protein YjbJ (UPF0337 family)
LGNEQQNEGTMDRLEGDVKEGVGKVTGNDRMEWEGKAQQGEGDVKKGVGDVREGVDRAADDFNANR